MVRHCRSPLVLAAATRHVCSIEPVIPKAVCGSPPSARLAHAGTCLPAIIKRDGMRRFREEQPAFDHHARGSRHRGNERQHGACGGAAQQPGERKQDERNEEPPAERDAAQLGGVPTRDPISHFSEQVILLRVRRVEPAEFWSIERQYASFTAAAASTNAAASAVAAGRSTSSAASTAVSQSAPVIAASIR